MRWLAPVIAGLFCLASQPCLAAEDIVSLTVYVRFVPDAGVQSEADGCKLAYDARRTNWRRLRK